MPNMSQQQPAPTASKQTAPQSRRPQKITQLQCLDQNTELKSYFITWLSQSFKYFPSLLSNIYLQLQLVINFIQYRFTVSEDHSQVGDFLQNIKYKPISKKIKILYLLLDIVAPYLRKRLGIMLEGFIDRYDQQKMSLNINSEENQSPNQITIEHKLVTVARRAISIIRFLQKIYALASFLNLSVFIYDGKYRTLIQRVLKMEMQFVNPENSRVLNFTLMNRNMIWQIYDMVLKNLLPYMHKFLGESLKNIFYLHSYLGVQQTQDNQNCVLCGQTPTMAVKAESCEHVYCFYCTKSLGQEVNQCKKCSVPITGWNSLYV